MNYLVWHNEPGLFSADTLYSCLLPGVLIHNGRGALKAPGTLMALQVSVRDSEILRCLKIGPS